MNASTKNTISDVLDYILGRIEIDNFNVPDYHLVSERVTSLSNFAADFLILYIFTMPRAINSGIILYRYE
jgi:hypothetical protein